MNLKTKFDSISFEDITLCKKSEALEILNIRNEDSIRKNMFTKNLITKDQHMNWLNDLKNTNKNKIYCIKYMNKVIGALGIKEKVPHEPNFEWTIYVSQNFKVINLGALIELKALDYLFSKYKIENLMCYVLKENYIVAKLHKKFGFNEKNLDKTFNLSFPNINIDDVLCLHLDKNNWNIINKKFSDKFLNS
jgi:UDP-4-amino-4,6-dideoxy-N-acetyl-beta-L-altrosamine N-acetyltransferase|tara:strand:- start:145 stop:720 length:576 start_codon:yes stop_codon:yes gene_type:complete